MFVTGFGGNGALGLGDYGHKNYPIKFPIKKIKLIHNNEVYVKIKIKKK